MGFLSMVVSGSPKRWDRWHSPSPNWQEKYHLYTTYILPSATKNKKTSERFVEKLRDNQKVVDLRAMMNLRAPGIFSERYAKKCGSFRDAL